MLYIIRLAISNTNVHPLKNNPPPFVRTQETPQSTSNSTSTCKRPQSCSIHNSVFLSYCLEPLAFSLEPPAERFPRIMDEPSTCMKHIHQLFDQLSFTCHELQRLETANAKKVLTPSQLAKLAHTYLYLLIPTHTRKTHHHPYPLLRLIASGKTPGTAVRTCGT